MRGGRAIEGLSALSRGLWASAAVLVVLALVGSLTQLQWAGDASAQEAPAKPEGAAVVKVDQARAAALVPNEAAIAEIEDPIVLRAAGKAYLANKNNEMARKCFEAFVARDELNVYASFAGTPFGEAVVLELLGEFETSRAKWRELLDANPIDTYFYLRRYSIDDQKKMLLAEIADHVKAAVKKAKAGEKAKIYTTKKGAPRNLTVMTMEEAMKSFEEGQRLRYVYIEELDVTGKVFKGRVGCVRCVVGSIKGYGSSFEEQFDFRGMVLGDVHLGKKWKGEVNKSAFIAAGTFNRLYLDSSVIMGNLNLDSAKITGRVANMPLMVVEGDVNMRNSLFESKVEFRFAYISGRVDAKGSEFHDSNYFGNTHFGELDFSRVVVKKGSLYFNSAVFAGPVLFEKCELHRGATFENAVFKGDVTMRQSRIYDRLNFSRSQFLGGLTFVQIELTDLDFLGSTIAGQAQFSDCVFTGNVRFALDGLTRRLHLEDATPLHKLYKQYQGDDDADSDLTKGGQYGVTHVDDLTAKMQGNVSFANTIFQKFVNFEGVQFGSPGQESLASFFNTQFYGEAHFERTDFFSTADFRTIFGNEVSFNDARFHKTWMLDDANVPGRLSLSGAELPKEATLSFYGARIAGFGITFSQLIDNPNDRHRLFHERCVHTEDFSDFLNDPRLDEARWDRTTETEITDAAQIEAKARQLCLSRTIQEFVVMKDSFTKRGMGDENDWAFWHMRHYKNLSGIKYADSPLGVVYGAFEWLVFEKGFGWGVRLSNLLGTALVVVLIFVLLLRLLCGEMQVDLDDQTVRFKDLPLYAMFMVSFHIFLGRARDWKSKVSPASFKILYTTEMIIGIILITFFIGAYTRLVLR